MTRRRQLDRDLREEVDTHLALIEDEERASGDSAEAARQRARLRFGSPGAHRERALDDVIATSVESAVKELGFAARRLVRSPAFTVAAVLTLALAIAANAAIFAVVERVLLNPLPYPDSDRLVDLDHGALAFNRPQGFGITRGYYYLYLERAHSLESLALYAGETATLTGTGEPERIGLTRATPSLASVMRVQPITGRWFTEEEGRPGAPPRVLLSHGFWMRRFGGDPHVLGRTIALSGVSYEVIGVMPASFEFPDTRTEAWAALQITRTMGFGIWLYRGVARLRDGVSVVDARTEMTRLIPDVTKAFPGDPFAIGNSTMLKAIAATRTLKDALIGDVATGLWIVLAAVSLVLLVACANVANLFLVRSEVRQREVSVRRALGAGQAGIARYFLAESVLLSAAGGLLGLVIAWVAVQLLVANGPATLPRLREIRLDRVSIAYTGAMALLTAVVFGAVPLFRGDALAMTLNDGGRGNTVSRSRHRARRLLMAGQVALALVLLIASGLMVRSFQKMRNVDPGFNPTSTMTFNVALPASAYKTRDTAFIAQHSILDHLATLPGVLSAASSTGLPFAPGGFGNTVFVQNRPRDLNVVPPAALFQAVSGGFFETMGIRLLRGRTLTRDDVEHRQRVAVISDALATRLFPREDPMGRYIVSAAPPARLGGPPAPEPLQIVGIVANTATRTLTEEPGSIIYTPMSIAAGPDIPLSALVGPDISTMYFVLRTTVEPTSLSGSIRRAVDVIDPKLAIAQVRTLQSLVDRASAQMAFTMVLIAIAACVALALGVVGIYGVMSYIVSQRTGEIGVRLALGAEPKAVAAMILRQGSAVTGIGAVVGLTVSLAGSRLIASLLYGIGPRDPMVFVATTILLLLVATLACWLPARSAARLSPLEALRTD
ncbi:MAG TPA: ABC transporter permease [Vicinamibacterales bacterium]|nr:ABC transporter permease [Vicinamibacterales bacterium]